VSVGVERTLVSDRLSDPVEAAVPRAVLAGEELLETWQLSSS
jgi:hypothetical protein